MIGEEHQRTGVIGLVDGVGKEAAFRWPGFIDCTPIHFPQVRTTESFVHRQLVERAFALEVKLIAEGFIDPLIFGWREFELPQVAAAVHRTARAGVYDGFNHGQESTRAKSPLHRFLRRF